MHHILVIEDDADIGEMLQDLLTEYGYSVALATTGQRGLDQLRTGERPDVLVLDYRLPDMDAAALVPAVRQVIPRLPILLMTAFMDAAERGAALDVACTLRKPFEPAELSAEIERCLAAG